MQFERNSARNKISSDGKYADKVAMSGLGRSVAHVWIHIGNDDATMSQLSCQQQLHT